MKTIFNNFQNKIMIKSDYGTTGTLEPKNKGLKMKNHRIINLFSNGGTETTQKPV